MSLPGYIFACEKVSRSGRICRWPFLLMIFLHYLNNSLAFVY